MKLTTTFAVVLIAISCSPNNKQESNENLIQEAATQGKELHEIGRKVYKGFAENNLDLWDAVIGDSVEIRSTVGEGMPLYGRDVLKGWSEQFLTAFRPKIDLIDEFNNGKDRAMIGVNIHWEHTNKFFDFEPTGKSGTAVEYFILTIENGKVERFWVVDHTFDLAIYLTEELGMPYPTNFVPPAIIEGVKP